jgi:sialate O-acetylesterase
MPRVYRVPAHLVQGGELLVAVRARSHFNDGGLVGPAAEMRLAPVVGLDGGAVPLDGSWHYAIEQDWGVQTPPAMQLVPGNPNAPCTQFDSRLAPIIPYGVRGVIWYQGESNVGDPATYRRLLPQLIADWRRAFGQGDLPFLQVQLANHLAVAQQPKPSAWAEVRDIQAATALADPQGGLAVAIDVGEAGNIHPMDKRTVGQRLARWALASTYGLGGAPCGPLFDSLTIEAGGRMRVRFRHAQGLRTSDGKAPARVAIAGANRTFVWAETAIEDDTLLAWHQDVPRPSALRYAWADNPEGCNLTAGDGAPAAPFRSDAW